MYFPVHFVLMRTDDVFGIVGRPQTTIGTAMVLCHRFFVRQSHACHDRFVSIWIYNLKVDRFTICLFPLY